MRIRTLRGRRAALAAAGLLAAGALTGCRGGGAPFAYSGVARGDIGTTPMSPAFAQVSAGQRMTVDPKGTVTFLAAPMTAGQPDMISPGTPLTMTQPNGQPIVGSGGVVYPVGYTQSGHLVMSAPAMNVQSPSPTPTYPMMMSAGGQMMPASMPAPQPVMMSMPAPAPTSSPTSQPMLMLVQGPNGPQYMIVEMMASPAAVPQPATAGPAIPMPPTTTAAPVVTPAAATTPFAAAPPLPVPMAPAPEPAPSFDPPQPAKVPMPMLPPPPAPAEMGTKVPDKAPDPLPPGVSAKPPTGPVLPVVYAPEPSLGSFPPAPAPSPAPAVKLPAPTGAVEGDIPSAPIFLPAPR